MKFKLIKASIEYKPVFENLMQFYFYDFSEYLKFDLETNGLFQSYQDLASYWNDENEKFPYLIMSENSYVGFVLVKKVISIEQDYFSIGEFFILRKYRRGGIGKSVAFEIFNLHRGKWEVYQKERNMPAQLFWKSTIHDYTKGKFNEQSKDGKLIQNFENFKQ